MTTLHFWAQQHPDKPALIQSETGNTITFGELDARAGRAAHWLVSRGLEGGDGIALLVENHPGLIEVATAARRVGLYYTAVNTHLAPAETAYVLNDCGAKLLVTSPAMLPLVEAVRAVDEAARAIRVFVLDGASTPLPAGFGDYDAAIAAFDAHAPLPERPLGRDMLYSSGTTGRPKGIRRPLTSYADRDQPDPEITAWRRAFGFDEHSVYLSPAPFYHAAPLRYVLRTLDQGGTCVVMAKFDAAGALAAIPRYRVTHSQWVPTMFVRLLGLPEDVRNRHDVSSMKVAIHAAAPCPVHVKQAMLDWWGDVLYEYYAGSEGAGVTTIGPGDWRRYPGSVGRATTGVLHIVGEDGSELPPNEVGMVYFSGAATFAYHNDPEKTRAAYNDKGWATYGDLGYVNEEGYLFLSDRRADLILSGGVNVYPQEIESVLMRHPAVADVAVVGVPDAELGEVPKAVIELRDSGAATPELAQAIVDACQGQLGRLKLPRTVVFDERLPRTPTGKLLRRELKDRHRAQPQSGHAVRTIRS